MSTNRWTLFCLLMVLILSSAPLLAGRSQQSMSKSEAVEIARGQVHGRVLSVTTDVKGGKKIYRVRILTESGRVRNIRIDARSGNFVRRPSQQH